MIENDEIQEATTVDLVHSLKDTTDQMLVAARKLDGPSLQDLAATRSDLVFKLQLRLEDEVPTPEQLSEIRSTALLMRETELRLARLASLVTGALDRVLCNQPPAVYGRSGQLGG